MPVACLLVVAAIAAQSLPPSRPAAIDATAAIVAATARRATTAVRNADRPRHTADSLRVRGDLARLNADPPRLASGYRAAQLDLRWHAPDVTASYPP